MPLKRAPMGKRMPKKIVAPPTEEYPLDDPAILRVRKAYYRNRRKVFAAIGKRDPYAVESKLVPRWDGGYDEANNKNYRTVAWAVLLQFIVDNQCSNIEGYITAQFQMQAANYQHWDIPEPNKMRNDKALANYSAYLKDVERSLPRALITQCNIFDAQQLDKQERMPGLPQRDYWQLVLEDTTNDLMPLFRYCVVKAENLHLMLSYQMPALNQLLLDPNSYQTYWKAILPPDCLQPVLTLLQIEEQKSN